MPNNTPDVESVRKRPAMYIGGRDFFGFVHYLVSAFDLLLQNGATWIEIEVEEEIHLASDAQIPLYVNADSLLEPFEVFGNLKQRYAPDAVISMALSERFVLAMTDGEVETYLECESGERKAFHQRPVSSSPPGIQLTFAPDFTIFSVTEISPAALHSYCRRTACLYPGVLLRVKAGNEVTEHRSEHGIRDFFTAIATPYQILHTPIHLAEVEADLKVEAVFVFHSWSENRIWSFSNKGRVPDGGTHEAGMLDAIASIHNNSASTAGTGILGVLAIEYPHVTFEGCIKARIGNPELRDKVAALMSRGLQKWIAENEQEVEYLNSIERFQFAHSW